jgi:two-component system, NtrC family, sensor histidine kinase HydH
MTPTLDDLKRALAFETSDAASLRAFFHAAQPHLETIADRFYERIERHPTTRELLGGRSRIVHLKTTLVAWMESSLRGPHDERYHADRERIGRMHIRAGLPQSYILATMNLLRQCFHEIATAQEPTHGLGAASATSVRIAIDKLIDLELAIMLESYRKDAEERLRESERHRLVRELEATGALATGLADELRNPLNSACLQLRVLDGRLRRSGVDSGVCEPLELAQAEVERLARLVDDVLSLAEPRRGGLRSAAPAIGPARRERRPSSGAGTA